jgi:hypothetical protein
MKRCLTLGVVAALLSPSTGYAQWFRYPTPGIPRLPDGRPNLSAPAPRDANRRPELSGIWAGWRWDLPLTDSLFFDLARDLPPSDVEMTPWAAAIQAQRESRDHVDDPIGYCLPPGVPRIDLMMQFKILVTPQETALLYETAAGLMFRQVFTDGRRLPEVTEPTWLGYSIGRWEGDTFVVETTGFKDAGWLDSRKGRPHSDALHVTERFHRIDFGHLALTITINDPKAYRKPWTVTTTLNLMPDTELLEGFCDNHDKTMEHRRITTPVPEPPSPDPDRVTIAK